MPSPPTRRKRSSTEERSLPIVPILIGVIVLGFVIGAGLSLSGRHDTTVVAVASPSPGNGGETFVPVTPAPTEKPLPLPTAAPASTARPKSVRAAASAPAETATPQPVTATPAATATPAKPVPAKLAAPRRLAAAPAIDRADAVAPAASPPPLEPHATRKTEAAGTSEAAPPIVAPATAAPQTLPAPVVTTQSGESAFARLSAAVVRQYLESVKRGDQDAAFAVLASPPKSEADLAEFGIVDERTRVARVDAHDAANSDALVSVQMDTPNGPYFGQYTVHKSDTGAAVIVAHSIVKP